MNRVGVLGNYRRLTRSEYLPQEQLRDIQLERLKRLLDRANRFNPYYAAKFKQIGMDPRDIRSLDDLKHVPALSRDEVIKNTEVMMDTRFAEALDEAQRAKRAPGMPLVGGPFSKKKLVRNTSSGSTGAPVIFYDDGTIAATSWAFEMRLRHWYVIEPVAREARMARVSVDYMPNDRQVWMRKRLWHQLMLPGINLADREYQYCLDRLREFRPRVLWGFTSALAGLADYIKRTGQDVSDCRPALAIGWAAPVYEHEERLLKEVLGCAVTNIYGAREVGHVAAWCPEHTWHINQEHMLVETNENPRDGEIGEVLVTPLDASPMPFIRYRLGDLGRPGISKCGCGRTLQVLENFLGRTGEIFVTKDGRMIPPNFWCRFFMVDQQSEFIERFQVIYRRPDYISILLVKRQGFSPATEEDMRKILRRNFSSDVHFEFEYVPEIKPMVSGKYQMVVNELKQQQTQAQPVGRP
jgi:phenylacetate-CoA ligase